MNSVSRASSPSEPGSEALAVMAAVRFARILRHRKHYMVLALVATFSLGTLYYLAKPKVYLATASLLITHNGADVLANAANPTGPRDSLIPTYEKLFSSAIVIDGALQRIHEMPPELKIDFASVAGPDWPTALRRNLTASALRRTDIIEISYRSKSPEAGRAVVRAVVDSYLDFMEQYHKDASVQTVEILDNERKDIEARLTAKQQQLLAVMHRVRDLGLGEDSNVVHPAVQRVLRLNETLVQVQENRLRLQAKLAAIENSVRSGGDLRQHLISVDPDVGRELVLNGLGLTPEITAAIGRVEQKLIDDRAKLTTLNRHLGSAHPRVLEAQEAIHNAEQYLAAAHASINQRLSHIETDQLGPMLLSMVRQQLADAQAHEYEVSEQYARSEEEAIGLSDRRAELQIVETEIQRLRSLHETLLNRIANVDINTDKTDVRVAVVSEAAASDKPVSPRLATVVLLCLAGGLGGGSVLVYVMDLMDDRFRSPEELSEQLGLPLLAMVSRLPSVEGTGLETLQLHVDPTAVESEAFRTLRTTLNLADEDRDRVAITSSEPSDGKTTVLTNLAVAYAQAGKRTLLIDADLRRPGLSKLLGVRGHGGLADVLRDTEEIGSACRKYIRATGIERLDVLPCGSRPPDPAELLGRTRMGDLIAWTDDAYDQILIDCPPMLAASDAALVGHLVDAVILVVKPEDNPRRAVLRAAGSLASLGINVAGVVANFIGDGANGGYYGYGEYGYSYKEDYPEEDDLHDDEEEAASTIGTLRPAEDAPAPYYRRAS